MIPRACVFAYALVPPTARSVAQALRTFVTHGRELAAAASAHRQAINNMAKVRLRVRKTAHVQFDHDHLFDPRIAKTTLNHCPFDIINRREKAVTSIVVPTPVTSCCTTEAASISSASFHCSHPFDNMSCACARLFVQAVGCFRSAAPRASTR